MAILAPVNITTQRRKYCDWDHEALDISTAGEA